jgi:SNF2 family DNA or RNA helicase
VIDDAGYTLTVNGRTLIARGPTVLLNQLAAVPQARRGPGRVDIPLTREALMIAEAVGQPTVCDRYRELRRKAFAPTRDRLTRGVEAVDAYFGEEARPNLLTHQWEFIAHALPTNGILNASEQGLGKTRMAAVLALAWGCQRIVIALPKDLATQWGDELHFLSRRVQFANLTLGTKEHRAGRLRLLRPVRGGNQLTPIVVVVNYEVLRDLREQVNGFAADCFIFDESWKIKNPSAKVTKSAIWLTDKMRDRTRMGKVLCLSGTPVGKDIGDLWAQLRVLGPQAVDGLSYQGFLHRFAVLKPLQVSGRIVHIPDGIRDPVGLMRLVYRSWFRATKAACLSLPPKVHHVQTLALPTAVRRLYEDVERRGEQALGNALALTGEAVKLLRLQQICGGTKAVWLGEEMEEMEALEDVRRGSTGWGIEWLPSPKLDWLLTRLRDDFLPHPFSRVIVWCRFNTEVERITEELKAAGWDDRVALVWGSTKTRELDAIKRSFNSRDPEGVQIIVAQVKKLFAGHNLQATDWNFDYSLDWSHIVNSQKEDRSHRMGRMEEVNYVRLICVDTVEEAINSQLETKARNAGLVTPGTASDVRRE